MKSYVSWAFCFNTKYFEIKLISLKFGRTNRQKHFTSTIFNNLHLMVNSVKLYKLKNPKA